MKKIQKIIMFVFLFAFLSTTSMVLAVENKPIKQGIPEPKINQKAIPKIVKPVHQKPVRQVKIAKPENLNNANGIITKIEADTITLSLENKSKKNKEIKTKIILLTERTKVNKDLTQITLKDLKEGDSVRISMELVKGTYYAKSIRVMTENTENLIKENRNKKSKS